MEINDFDKKIKILLDDFENIKSDLGTIYGKKLFILYLHLYLDYFVSEMYEIKLLKLKEEGIEIDSIKYHNEINSTLSLKNKATHLIIWGLVDNKYFKTISTVCTARNKLAHNLDPDIEVLEKLMKEVIEAEKPENDTTGLIGRYLDQADLWVKWVPFAFATVFHLYKHLHMLNGTQAGYSIHMTINPESTQVQSILSPNSLIS